MLTISDIDMMIGPAGRYEPRWGYHDQHRDADGTEDYLPALQQVRMELAGLLNELLLARLAEGKCLQLGLGECQASHDVWNTAFLQGAITIDRGRCLIGDAELQGADTRDSRALGIAARGAPYDLLIIDAGHTYADVELDHKAYGPYVRKGGIIAFHDAVQRHGPQFESLEVWRYLETLSDVRKIGSEVGWALIRT